MVSNFHLGLPLPELAGLFTLAPGHLHLVNRAMSDYQQGLQVWARRAHLYWNLENLQMAPVEFFRLEAGQRPLDPQVQYCYHPEHQQAGLLGLCPCLAGPLTLVTAALC